MKEDKINRIAGLDLIRVVAILFVIAGHFFWLNTEFLRTDFKGLNMFFQGTLMSLFFSAVPIFVLLTGFLNYKKEFSLKYYKGIKKVLSAYLIFCVISILFRIFYLGETQTAIGWIKSILGFSAVSYSWYIEFYIGLFCMIPFLNIIIAKLSNKKEHLWLIFIFMLVTSLPLMLNRGGEKILPAFFTTMAPFTFYFTGAFIAKYRPKIKKTYIISLLLFLCIFDSTANMLLSNTFAPIGGQIWSPYYLLSTTAIFLLLYDLKFSSDIVSRLSTLTLEIYLCSWIFDTLYYPLFKTNFFVSQQQFLKYIIIIVPLVFISSALTAYVKDRVAALITLCLPRKKQA